MASPNQTPEQAVRDRIDEMLSESGWVDQDNKKIDFSASLGVAVREYQTDVGPADYVLFIDKKQAYVHYYLLYRYEDTRRVGSGNNQKALNKRRRLRDEHCPHRLRTGAPRLSPHPTPRA